MLGRYLIFTSILMAFWIALTGSLEPSDLILGLALSVIAVVLSIYILGADIPELNITGYQLFHLILYIPFLMVEIIKANFDVAERVLRPSLPINPMVIRYRAPFDNEIGRVTMANSITLTPGTLTLEIERDVFLVHCLAEVHKDGLYEGRLFDRVHAIFRGRHD